MVKRGRGGDQEREIAAQYRDDSDRLASGWLRTAALLARIADRYESEAWSWDRDKDLRDLEG